MFEKPPQEDDLSGQIWSKLKKINEGINPLVRSLNYIILSLSFLTIFQKFYDLFALIPDKFLQAVPFPYLWNVVTSGLFENNIFFLIFHLGIINLVASKFENIWSSKHLLIMIGFVNAISGLIEILGLYFFSLFNIWTESLSSGSSSLNGIIIIFMIGLRQNYYENRINTIIPFSENTLKIPYRKIAGIYIICSILFSIILETEVDFRLISSFLFGWLYMRFYMRRELTQNYGDSSSQFCLANFFPDIVSPYIGIVSDTCYSSCRKCGIVPDLSHQPTGTLLDKSSEFERKKALNDLETELEAFIEKEGEKKPEEMKITMNGTDEMGGDK